MVQLSSSRVPCFFQHGMRHAYNFNIDPGWVRTKALPGLVKHARVQRAKTVVNRLFVGTLSTVTFVESLAQFA